MKAYSDDLRARVLAAYAVGDCTIPQVAARFRVSESFVNKLLRRQRTSGSAAARPHRGGPAPALDVVRRAELSAHLAQHPDATLAELGEHLAAGGGPSVGQTTIWKAVRALDWRRKKKASTPPSATPSG